METSELRKLAEQNLAFILKRAAENQGRVSQEELASGSFFCRIVEAETVGSPYAGAATLRNWDGDLAKAAVAVPVGS